MQWMKMMEYVLKVSVTFIHSCKKQRETPVPELQVNPLAVAI
jgi:hypothetical protein